jgi:hypothetical protein
LASALRRRTCRLRWPMGWHDQFRSSDGFAWGLAAPGVIGSAGLRLVLNRKPCVVQYTYHEWVS